MKKLFTLLTLVICSIGVSWAGDVFTISYNGKDVQSTDGYFTHSAKHNFNTKFSGGNYGGISFKSGLKMEGATEIYFTSNSTATLTIVQSAWESNGVVQTNKLDGTELVEGVRDDVNKVVVHTIENLPAGEHKITRGSGENGLYYVKVEYTGEAMIQLATPEISYDASTGVVTIADISDANGIYYTTDGTTPSADNGTKYETSFTVDDGTLVKAIAVGNGTTTMSSSIAEKQVIRTGITIAAPVISVYNGTVAIMCASKNASIEYSTDGTTYTAYGRAFTLMEDKTVYARASREGCTTSEIASKAVAAVPAGVKSKTIYMGFGSFDSPANIDGFHTLKGRAGDPAEGYSLILNVSGKTWSSSNAKVTMANNETRTAIKGSNGAQTILRLPEGIKATKLTLYSFINAASGTRTTGWREVNGEDLTSIVNEVPMGANSDKKDYLTNPDMRVFPLDNVSGEITFANTGEQVCFVIALDVIEPSQTVTISDAKFATCVANTDLDFAGTDVTAYTVSEVGETTVTLVKTDKVKAGQTVVVGAEAAGAYDIPTTTEVFTAATSLMASSETEVPVTTENSYYIVANGDNGVGFYPVQTGTSIPAGKGYIEVPANSAKGRFLSFGIGGGTSGISDVKAATAEKGEIYNLNGQRVAAPAKGLYIMNGKKVIFK
ncbi:MULTISPECIES: FN3 associated domain-containing protein [unclassified Prevotella]|uniref:FN3 associated domain-containing protein n=1 Tax=unclassified Prevotella TaxID=2638335 RepID=UPI000CEA5437|nr:MULTISPECIES: FN3 associated domain-containing protein [unclassified Prevotella]MCX4294050.1 chitobiase/beta-hexosaminidase C-terminal domain-containing protein [Prevotella sp.]NPD55465.1 hypothetical protein [Prevotella sp. PTAC]